MFRHFWRYLAKLFLEWEMFQIKVEEKIKTHILFSITFSENCTVYEIMSKNIVKTEGPQMMSQYGAYALCTGLARLHAHMCMYAPMRPGTHMHAHLRKHAHTDQYVILIAFPQQQWFCERASMLRCTYISCLVIYMLHLLLFNVNDHKSSLYLAVIPSCT
jgi:hypothetical protein